MASNKLFRDSEVVLKDLESLTDILNNDLNVVCANLYFMFGMTDVTKKACEAFYKLRIKILEMAINRIEEAKDSSGKTISHPETVTRLAICQAELEEAVDAYGYFLTEGKIKEE
jgi:hypothetical protein